MKYFRYSLICVLISLCLLSSAQGYRIIGPWKPIFQGAEIAYCSTDTPRLEKVTAIRIDLTEPALSFFCTPSNGADPYDTLRQTGTQFMASHPCQFGVNSQYYLTYGDNADIEGVCKSEGVIISPLTDNWPIRKGTLLITSANVASMAMTGTTFNLTPYRTAVESRDGYIMKNGVIDTWGDTSIHPRTGVGISYDGRYMVFVTIDGRQTGYSDGCTHTEVAEWLVDFGCYNAMNLDGGGSTHMLISDGAGGSITVNSPSEDRAVATHIGAYMDDLPAPTIPLPPVTSGLIIQLAADSLNLADGAAVTSWADNATSDTVNGTVSTVAGYTTPVFKTNIYNGKPVVRFSDDILATAQFSLPSPTAGITMFAVFTGDSSAATAERVGQIGEYAGSGGKVIGMDASITTSGTDGGSGFRFNNGRSLVNAGNPLNTSFHTACWKMAQGAQQQNAIYYVDGVQRTFNNVSYPTRTVTLPTTGNIFSLGTGRQTSAWLTTDYYTGDVAEVLVYNAQLTTQQITDVTNYLNKKYDLDPPVQSGLIIHLRADQLQLSDGDTVKEWPDAALNDTVDGTLYTVGDLGVPVFDADGYNGKPAVQFSSASSQAMISENFSWTASQGVTMFVVCQGGSAAIQRVAQVGNGGVASQNVGCDASPTVSGFRFNDGYATATSPFTAGQWHVSVRKIAQGGRHDSAFYAVNNTTALTMTCNNPANTMAFVNSPNYLSVGVGTFTGGALGSDYYNGEVAEILIYNRQLTTNEMTTVMNFLLSR